MIELKPCPFCGEVPSAEQTGFGWWIHCRNLDGCKVRPSGDFAKTEEEAAKIWNSRHKGRWCLKTDWTDVHVVCSECNKHFWSAMVRNYKYCPECGASMI